METSMLEIERFVSFRVINTLLRSPVSMDVKATWQKTSRLSPTKELRRPACCSKRSGWWGIETQRRHLPYSLKLHCLGLCLSCSSQEKQTRWRKSNLSSLLPPLGSYWGRRIQLRQEDRGETESLEVFSNLRLRKHWGLLPKVATSPSVSREREGRH